MALAFYNSLTKKVEEFVPIISGKATVYTCGPTVYDFAHIGNLRAYIFADTLRRALELEGFNVRQVMNITDIGHLTSDADDGEDKMVKALKREGRPMTLTAMREVADFYKEKFVEDLKQLRILLPHELENASDHIKEDIELLTVLEEKGYTYKTSDGIYFDTAKMQNYGVLGGINQEDEERSRIGENTEKHSPRDFALWKFSDDEKLGFPSPWGVGIPGWHIECSAMSRLYLGQPFDIHTGGIDHIPVHHNNEIAQSESAYGVPLAHVWMHINHLKIENERIAKSIGNTTYLKQITEKGIAPEAYRLWLLMAHYRTPINFTWEALTATQTALESLYELVIGLPESTVEPNEDYKKKFLGAIENDLDTPKAIALLFAVAKDEKLSPEEKYSTLLYMDRIFGLGFSKLPKIEVPDHVKLLILERDKARSDQDWKKSDEIRDQIKTAGFIIRDEKGKTAILPALLRPAPAE